MVILIQCAHSHEMAGLCTQNGSESRHNGGKSICGRVVSVLLPIPTFLKLCAQHRVGTQAECRDFHEGKVFTAAMVKVREARVLRSIARERKKTPLSVSASSHMSHSPLASAQDKQTIRILNQCFNSRSKQRTKYVLSTARVAFTRG